MLHVLLRFFHLSATLFHTLGKCKVKICPLCNLNNMFVADLMIYSPPAIQDGVTMPEGLWYNNGMALESDLATIVQRIRLLGFNAVRLPFSMQDLFSLQPKCVPCR